MQAETQIPTTPPLSGADAVDRINAALQTITTDFSGSDDPAALAWPFARWADTGNGRLKIRNASGTAWLDLGPLTEEEDPPLDGALYASQAWVSGKLTTINAAIAGLPGYLQGLILANNATDSANDIDIGAGVFGAGGAAVVELASTITKRLDASWSAGTNQGALDTGTKANSTWYYWFLISDDDGSSVDVLASATAPSNSGAYAGTAMPDGYTRSKFLGATRTDGSGNMLAFKMAPDRTVFWADISVDVVITSDSSGTLRTITVPPIPVLVAVRILARTSDSGNGWVRGPYDSNVAPTVDNGDFSLAAAGYNANLEKLLYTDTGQVRTRLSATLSSYLRVGVNHFKSLV